jgi:DNA-nicking Smr family endonuclease
MKKGFEVQDTELWHEVAKSVKPFGARGFKSIPAASRPISMTKPSLSVVTHAQPKNPPLLTGFDRRTEQKLVRGQVEIDGRIDLHGHGVEIARVELLHFIASRRAIGSRLILVITGKGASPFSGHTLHGRSQFQAPERQGRLRREVPEWLHEAAFRVHVIGFQQAHPRHGGGGALYVKLRRTSGP